MGYPVALDGVGVVSVEPIQLQSNIVLSALPRLLLIRAAGAVGREFPIGVALGAGSVAVGVKSVVGVLKMDALDGRSPLSDLLFETVLVGPHFHAAAGVLELREEGGVTAASWAWLLAGAGLPEAGGDAVAVGGVGGAGYLQGLSVTLLDAAVVAASFGGRGPGGVVVGG